MLGFLKRLFGGGSDSDEMLQQMMKRSEKWQVIGSEIAQDCYQNGLVVGEIVRLSEISNFIKQNHSYNSNVVENGFIKQMKSYIDQELVVNINDGSGDIVFVHKDHVYAVLRG